MKTLTNRFIVAIAFIAIFLQGCTKSSIDPATGNFQQPNNLSLSGTHVYGLLPMSPDQYMNLPLYSKETFQSGLVQKSVTLSPPHVYTLSSPPVRDQGQIGSCTAFCGAESDEILYYYKSGSWPALSPAFIYYCERVLILNQLITADQGAYMVNIPQALQKYGDCLETSYLYPTSNTSTAYKTAPPAAAFTEGLNYRIGQTVSNYALINSGDTAAVKNILRGNVPVMLGFNVYDNTSTYKYFEGLNTKSYTYNPLATNGSLAKGVRLLGGHAVPIIGYDDNLKAFLCENSWGTSWGNHGYFYMPYTVFRSLKIVPAGSVYYATL